MAQLHLDAGGRLRRHDAGTLPLMVVLQGEGEAFGQNRNAVAVRPGAVVVWEWGERHETRTDTGMDVLIEKGWGGWEGWEPTPSTRPTPDGIPRPERLRGTPYIITSGAHISVPWPERRFRASP